MTTDPLFDRDSSEYGRPETGAWPDDEVYFNLADEIEGGLTLDDLDLRAQEEARQFVEAVKVSEHPRVRKHLRIYGEPPWPPSLVWAEEFANTMRFGGAL